MADENNITTLAKRLRPFIKLAAQEMVPVTPYEHHDLSGLASDDHTQYVHNTTARTITAVHTFDPTSATAPFIIAADGQGQTVIGLKADQLNKGITAGAGLTGGGNLTADVSLAVGAGNGISVGADDISVKLPTYSGLTADGTGIYIRNDIAGDGLTISNKILAVGAGTLMTVAADTIGLSNGSAEYQVPLTGANPFTPAWVTTSDNPLASIKVLRTDASGYLTLVRLKTDYIASKTAATNLTMQPTGNIVLDPDGLSVNPFANYEINLGALSKKYLTLHCAELWVETLVAQNTIATIGGRILVGPTTTLTTDFLLSGGTNKIINPGFETLGGGGVDVFANWTEQAGDGSIWAEGTNKHSGTYGLALQEGASSNTYVYQGFAVNPGDTITFSFWTRGDGTNAGMYSIYDVTHGSWLVTRTTTGITSTTWAKTGTTYGIPAGCYSVSLYFWSPELTGGYAYFDDVYVTTQYILVKHNQMAPGDLVYMEANGKVEFMQISGGPWGADPFIYGVFRDLEFTGMNDWYAGDAIFNTGVPGEGWIDLYSISSMRGAGTIYGPTIQGVYRWGGGYSQAGEAWAIGNLNGLYGYSATTFGVGLGFYGWSYAHVTIDNTNGIRFGRLDGAGGYHKNAQWAPDGTLTIGNRDDGKANVQITDTGIYINQSNTINRINITSAGVLAINNGAGSAVFTFDASTGAEFTLPLTLGTGGGIYQGTGTFASPTTGLKIWRDGSNIGRIAGYNATYMQWEADTNGKFVAGAGDVILDRTGIRITAGNQVVNSVTWYEGSTAVGYIRLLISGTTNSMFVNALATGTDAATGAVKAMAESGGIGELTLQGAAGGVWWNWILHGESTGGYVTLTNESGISPFLADRNSVTINEYGYDMNFRVESDGNPNMINVDGGLNCVGIGKVPASGSVLDVSGRADFDNLLVVQGGFHMGSSMTRYTTGSGLACYAFVPLATPLTSTLWDGNESHSSDGSLQLMDLSSVFTAPGYIKAVLLQVTHMDSGANVTDCFITFFKDGTGNVQGPCLRCMPASDRWFGGQLVVTCDANGDIYRRIYASGTNTYEIFISILGYWI